MNIKLEPEKAPYINTTPLTKAGVIDWDASNKISFVEVKH